MNRRQSIHYSLSLISLAAFTGLIGFLVVYHYANFERQLQHFAIVIDAGSTQTRSNLFSVELDLAKLTDWSDERLDHELDEMDGSQTKEEKLPIANVFRVQQLGSCVNGAPLASIKNLQSANRLVETCIRHFSSQIRDLDFDSLPSSNDHDHADMELHKPEDRIGLLDGRFDSVTHIHLGATAGMRALSQLNETRALEKIHWVDEALNVSSQLQAPIMNKGFVGIISGADEAAFGWSSVNFACDTLRISRSDLLLAGTTHPQGASDLTEPRGRPDSREAHPPGSIGIVELGGNSAQMAYEVDGDIIDQAETFTSSTGLQLRDLSLFKKDYHLAYRSDLCLGMSQAILRLNYILLKDSHAANKLPHTMSNPSISATGQIFSLDNPCFQNGSRLLISAGSLKDTLSMPCFAEPLNNVTDFKGKMDKLVGERSFEFRGTGDASKCGKLLTKLIEPSECQRYFAICPASQNLQQPPKDVPFVTISGYNKALKVLNLERDVETAANGSRLGHDIANRLGGYPIAHHKLWAKVTEFCSVPIKDLGPKYPMMNPAFHTVNCLQLVYINKILTEFYRFSPSDGSWSQIRFLLFPAEGATIASGDDIGWTLGLLLNATSQQMSLGQQVGDQIGKSPIWYHHGASVAFVIRATILLMVACLFLALSLVTIASLSTGLLSRRRSGHLSIRRHSPPSYNTSSAACCVSVPEIKSLG